MNIVDIDKFRDVSPTMIWRGAALEQIDKFENTVATLAKHFRVTAEVVGTHRSKSIDLPVVKISTDVGEFTLRDNFYDINLMAVLRMSGPGATTTLSLEQFFDGIQEPMTWDWYLSEIERARGYSWREWSDEEANDPRILRVRDKRPGCDMWWEKRPEEKDRWAERMSNPAWFSRDWSSGEITWDGNFGPGVKLFHQKHAYAQGIDLKTSNWKYLRGIRDFIIATDTHANAITMIARLHGRLVPSAASLIARTQ
jgi:hypothetical protein